MSKISRRESLKIFSALGVVALFPVRTFSQIMNNTCDECLKVWNSLSKFNRTRYQFRYVEPLVDVPKVFIYGDSVSIGYTEYVRASLEGKATVHRFFKNGQSSNEFIKGMEALRKRMFEPNLKGGWNFEWDVIHFNVGLHDLKYLANKKLDKVNGKQVSTLALYEKNLEDIIQYLKNTYPKTKLIFANTTPVPEGAEGRFTGDAIKYNKVALKVIENHPEVVLNDLYTFSIPVWEKHGKAKDDVHYKPEGSRLQGIEVAKIIAETIRIETVSCPSSVIVEKRFKEYEKK